MLDKYNWIAVNVEEDGKLCAYAIRVRQNENLLSKLAINNIVSANICGTKKEAREIVNFWNDCYKQNGTYMFA